MALVHGGVTAKDDGGARWGRDPRSTGGTGRWHAPKCCSLDSANSPYCRSVGVVMEASCSGVRGKSWKSLGDWLVGDYR